MRLRRTVRKAENYARYSICRPNCLILILLFATPILVLYHMGLLHRNTGHNSDAVKSESHGGGGGGARPAINHKTDQENKSHIESFNTNVLIYNRVPKCGSIWMTRLLYLLGAGDHNNYNVESPYEPGEKPWLTQPQEELVISHLDNAPKPTVYIRHQYFIDFGEHEKHRPIYINVIRDPVEKFRSFYYFIRNGNLEGDGADVVMSEKKKLMTIDQCVELKVLGISGPSGKWSNC